MERSENYETFIVERLICLRHLSKNLRISSYNNYSCVVIIAIRFPNHLINQSGSYHLGEVICQSFFFLAIFSSFIQQSKVIGLKGPINSFQA